MDATVLDAEIAEVLEKECGLKFPAEYYDAVDPGDFRKVFKAGIKEVVEFAVKSGFVPPYHDEGVDHYELGYEIMAHLKGCRLCKWQAKLKEWGIE